MPFFEWVLLLTCCSTQLKNIQVYPRGRDMMDGRRHRESFAFAPLLFRIFANISDSNVVLDGRFKAFRYGKSSILRVAESC